MNFPQSSPRKICSLVLFIILTSTLIAAQQARGTLRGLITDELGAAIVGANVTVTDATGVQKKTTTNGEGVYNFTGLAPGKYTLQANAPGFAPSESKEIDMTAARQSVDLTLRVTIEEKVTVAETAVSTEATNNANQTVISGKDLDALQAGCRSTRSVRGHPLQPAAERRLPDRAFQRQGRQRRALDVP